MRSKNKLYDLRKKNRLSGQEVADVLGVSAVMVHRYERGLNEPNYTNTKILARLYKTTVAKIIESYESTSEY